MLPRIEKTAAIGWRKPDTAEWRDLLYRPS